MRTTVRLDDDFLVEVKKHAAETHGTLTRVIQDALTALLQKERGEQSPKSVRLPVFKGDGVHDGIDINNSASLFDHMELDTS